MKTKFFAVLLALAFGFVPTLLSADFIILDMDPSTAPVPGFPPGPGTGFESSITVTSGSTVTIVAYLVPSTPIIFDSFLTDINWGTVGDTATAFAVPATTFAGGVAGLGAPSIDFFAGGPTGPGVPLLPGPFAPIPGYASNIGGVGFFDAPIGANFGGLGVTPPAGTLFDIHGLDLTVLGAPGSSVSVMPSGLFDPFGVTPGLPTPGRPLLIGGDALYDQLSGFTTPTFFVGGSIFIAIPEPGSAIVLSLAAIGLIARRRKRV